MKDNLYFAVRVPDQLYGDLRWMAKDQSLSLQDLVKIALQKFINEGKTNGKS